MGAGLRYHSAVSFFLIAFPALFSIINPLGGSFIFLSATDHYPRPVRAQLALWVSIYSFAIVTGSAMPMKHQMVPIERTPTLIAMGTLTALRSTKDLTRSTPRVTPTSAW